jgi:preprotein translocase subunit SecY
LQSKADPPAKKESFAGNALVVLLRAVVFIVIFIQLQTVELAIKKKKKKQKKQKKTTL